MVLEGPNNAQIWMYHKEKLTKNLADLNTFETSVSLRDHMLKATIEPYSHVYLHMYTLPSCGSEVLWSYSHTGRIITMMLLKHSTVLKGLSSNSLFLFTFTPSFLLFRVKKSLASCPAVDTALVFFIWWWCEELCQLFYPGRSYVPLRFLVNVIQSGLWVTAVLTGEQRHSLPAPVS